MPAEPWRLAITGSAGVGKTTLAKALSAALGLPLLPEAMRRHLESDGRRLSALSAPARAALLERLWAEQEAQERDCARSGFVADNCALDHGAYALHHDCTDESQALLANVGAAGRRYDALFVLPWGAIPYERDGIRAASAFGERRYQLILEALIASHPTARKVIPVPLTATTPEARLSFCLATLRALRRRRGGFVSLVGAGPGDPGLLTRLALDRLEEADVVAYDSLIPAAVLAHIGAHAERLPVGHRGGQDRPERLHPLVLEHARAGKHVVRLKQGDPFLFGRGGEEAEALESEGIPFEVVPGITAALGAAAYAGIPLTHRAHASDVCFATGHDARWDDEPQPQHPASRSDWTLLASATSTLVLYMAGRRLAPNLRRLIAGGRAAETPCAYVVGATTPAQRVVVGTLATLPDLVAERSSEFEAGAPALVVVGEVVKLQRSLCWFQAS